MAKLVFGMNQSLDGYVDHMAFAPSPTLFRHFIEEVSGLVGSIYGRRMYEVMRAWESDEVIAGEPAEVREFAEVWRPAEKVVYSRTLEEAPTGRTRIEREFDPDTVRRMKAEADSDIGIGGPTLAAEAFRADLVDECHLVLAPAIVGAGTRALPDGVRLDLELLDERRFRNGFVHLHYRALSGPDSSAG